MFQQNALFYDVTLEELPAHHAYPCSFDFSPYLPTSPYFPAPQRQRILVLGDGNFTFSLAVAEVASSACWPAHGLVATSLDFIGDLKRKYGEQELPDTLSRLRQCGATVLHGADGSRLDASLPPEGICLSSGHLVKQFDRIVWNFPHCSAESDDGHNQRHHHLLSQLFCSCQNWLADEAEVHLTLLGKQPVRWGLLKAAAAAGFEMTESYKFNPDLFAGYKPVSEVPQDRLNVLTDFVSECHPE